jgi:hypothetical protein
MLSMALRSDAAEADLSFFAELREASRPTLFFLTGVLLLVAFVIVALLVRRSDVAQISGEEMPVSETAVRATPSLDEAT